MKRTAVVLTVALCLGATLAGAQNLVQNPGYESGLTNWFVFIDHGGVAHQPAVPASIFDRAVLGCDPPFGTQYLGTDYGTSAYGWGTGAAQEITGLTPGTTYTIQVQTQVILGFQANQYTTALNVYWRNAGGLTQWQTPNPAAPSSTGSVPSDAILIESVPAYQGTWKQVTAQITPSGSSISIGYFARWAHPEWGYSACNHAVDNWVLTSGNLPTATMTPTNTPVPPTATPTSPCASDFDSDTICDADEGGKAPAAGKSNLYLPDSDGDGLNDGAEDENRNGAQDSGETSTRAQDSDNDGYEDGIEELITGSNPLNSADPVAAIVDADGDKLPAANDPNDNDNDADNDRFTDGYEAVQLSLGAAQNNAQKPVLGDVNQDAFLDNADAQLTLNFFGNQGVIPAFTPTRTDVNRDAFIDNADSQIQLNFFGNAQPVYPSN